MLRDIADMDTIIAQLEKGATRAVVVGGSYIGLELTEAFKTRGLQTTVVERSERLMPWLDPEMTRILDYHVEANGVDLRLGTSATAVRRSESDDLVVDLDDGSVGREPTSSSSPSAYVRPCNSPATQGSSSARTAASRSTSTCAPRRPTSWRPGTRWRPRTS